MFMTGYKSGLQKKDFNTAPMTPLSKVKRWGGPAHHHTDLLERKKKGFLHRPRPNSSVQLTTGDTTREAQ